MRIKIQETECDTCKGEGEVFQEGGAGRYRMLDKGWTQCPDCNGLGVLILINTNIV